MLLKLFFAAFELYYWYILSNMICDTWQHVIVVFQQYLTLHPTCQGLHSQQESSIFEILTNW